MFCGITVGIAIALTIIIWTILTEWIIGPWMKWIIFGLSFLVIGGLAYLAKMSAMSSFGSMSSGMSFNRGGPQMIQPQYQQQMYQPIQQYQQPQQMAQSTITPLQALTSQTLNAQAAAQAPPQYPNTAQPFSVKL